MSIVTISRGSYSHGREVAETVAKKLGYECVSREILLEASSEFNVPQLRLLHAIADTPSFLDRFRFGKERYLAYIQAALLDHFQKDNVVYHGLAGHFFVRNVSHVLKVRIIAEMEDRVKLFMQRERTTREDEAREAVETLDEERRKWGRYFYGIDTQDASLYDLVIRIKKLSAGHAAEMICHAVESSDTFQATKQSQQAVDDLTLAARVRASLIDHYPRAGVTADGGVVHVGLEGATSRDEGQVQETARKIAGVKSVEITRYPFITPD